MKTYHVALCEIARISAEAKLAQYRSGYNQYRGFDSFGIAATLELFYPERDFKQIRTDFEDLEFELYEELKLK